MIRPNRQQAISFDGLVLRLTVVVCIKLHHHEAVKMRYVLWEKNGIMFMLDDPSYEELCDISKKTGAGFKNWNIVESECPDCHQEALCASNA